MACYDTDPWICTFDSNVPAGKDYSAISTWEAASDNDLVTGTDHPILDCYDTGTAGIHPDGGVYFTGATTNATYFRTIRSAPGCSTPYAGKPGTGACFEYTGATNRGFALAETFFETQSLCFRYNGSGASTYAFYVYAANIKTINVYLYDCTSSGSYDIDFHANADGDLFFGCISDNSEDIGFYIGAGAGETIGAVCCTAIGATNEGIHDGYSTGVAIAFSCYAGNNGVNKDYRDVAWDEPPSDYNASGDATAPGANVVINKDYWDGGGDDSMDGNHLLTASIDGGLNPVDNLSGSWNPDSFFTSHSLRLQSYDTTGSTTRSGTTDATWDVGASEYDSGGSPTFIPRREIGAGVGRGIWR